MRVRSYQARGPGARVSDWHRAIITGNLGWSKALVNGHDTVKRRLPQHNPIEEVGGEKLPDLHNDDANEPVDQIWDPFTV